jgi:hypothetical protein
MVAASLQRAGRRRKLRQSRHEFGTFGFLPSLVAAYDRTMWLGIPRERKHNSAAASFLELPLAPADAFTKACVICR